MSLITSKSRYNLFFALALAAFSGLAHASPEMVTTRIHTVLREAENTQIFSTIDARVYNVAAANEALIAKLEAAVTTSEPLHLILENDEIVDIRNVSLEERAQFSDAFVPTAEETIRMFTDTPVESEGPPFVMDENTVAYNPTVFATTAEAQSVFRGMDHNMRSRSQCYQRAHYWAYAMWNYSNIRSMKTFLFFTKKYIREYRYKWWFHVAPFVYAGGMEMVLDPEFLNSATEMHAWTKNFVRAPGYCPAASSYQEYESGQESHYCYVRKVPMYHYQPQDVQRADASRTVRNGWVDWELKNSQCAKRFCWRVGGTPTESNVFTQ